MHKHRDTVNSGNSHQVKRGGAAWYQFMTSEQGVAPSGFENNSGLTIAADIANTFAKRTTAHGVPAYCWARGKQSL